MSLHSSIPHTHTHTHAGIAIATVTSLRDQPLAEVYTVPELLVSNSTELFLIFDSHDLESDQLIAKREFSKLYRPIV